VKLDPSAFVADPELIQALEQRSTPVNCGEERVLFRQGDIPEGLYILNAGQTVLTMNTPSGEELISDEPYTLTATARTGAKLHFVHRDDFTGMMKTDPSLGLKILQVLAAEVRSARRALANR